MVGDGNDALYTVDAATGVAARVGSADGFGASENSPKGLASGYAQPLGYEIDASTGEISYTGGPAVAGVHTLYVQVSDGRAASGGGTSRAVDAEVPVTVDIANQEPTFSERSYSYTLASGSDGSVTPVAVDTPPAVDPEDHTLAYSLRASDPAGLMYMLGATTNALHTLDSTTGAVTARVGSVARFGVNETDPRGLTWHNGQLYMTGSSPGGLYTLDITTGEATRIIGDAPVTLMGAASHNGELYVTANTYTTTATGHFYRVDLDTSTLTRIGGDDFGVDETSPAGIASHGSPAVLYMIGIGTDALYTVDTATGMAVRVGSSEAFGADEYNPSGLTSRCRQLVHDRQIP